MEQKAPLFKGSVDGVQFNDYRAFTKFLHEHPDSTRIEFSLDSSVVKKSNPSGSFTATCRVVDEGKVLNPNELIYPLLETPDRYLAAHDQSEWLSNLENVVEYVNSFIPRHQENIKYRSNEELEEHMSKLQAGLSEIEEALGYNEEADRSVRNAYTKYSKEVEDLNKGIKDCKQRINVIRREEIPTLQNKKLALTAVGKLLTIYKETYTSLQAQVTKELDQRKNNNLRQLKPSQLKSSQDNKSGMIRLLDAIFGM